MTGFIYVASGVDSESSFGPAELILILNPGSKLWFGIDSDSESGQNGIKSGFRIDSGGIEHNSADDDSSAYFLSLTSATPSEVMMTSP